MRPPFLHRRVRHSGVQTSLRRGRRGVWQGAVILRPGRGGQLPFAGPLGGRKVRRRRCGRPAAGASSRPGNLLSGQGGHILRIVPGLPGPFQAQHRDIPIPEAVAYRQSGQRRRSHPRCGDPRREPGAGVPPDLRGLCNRINRRQEGTLRAPHSRWEPGAGLHHRDHELLPDAGRDPWLRGAGLRGELLRVLRGAGDPGDDALLG